MEEKFSARNQSRQVERLKRFLEKCSADNFYGKVEVTFQNGQVNDVRIMQNKKIEEL